MASLTRVPSSLLISSGGDMSMAAFGELRTTSLEPQAQLKFVHDLTAHDEVMDIHAVATGAASTTNAKLHLITGATAQSSLRMESVRRAVYHPGQGIEAKFTALFDASTAELNQAIGVGTVENFAAFGSRGAYGDGSVLGIIHRSRGSVDLHTLTITVGTTGAGDVTITLNGVAHTVAVTIGTPTQSANEIAAGTYNDWYTYAIGATVIFVAKDVEVRNGAYSLVLATATGTVGGFVQDRAGDNAIFTTDEGNKTWNVDTMDGAGPSGVTIDPERLYVYAITFGYLGAAPLRFFILTEKGFTLVHRIKWSTASPNTQILPTFTDASFPLFASIENNADAVSYALESASMAVSIQGGTNHTIEVTNGHQVSVAIVTSTQVAIFSLRVKRAFKTALQSGIIRLLHLGGAVTGNNEVKVQVLRNATIAGVPAWTELSANSIVDFADGALTQTTTGGTILATFTVSKWGNVSENLIEILSDISPGEVITFAAATASGNSDVTLGCSWGEQP